jgi:hypothetical protein
MFRVEGMMGYDQVAAISIEIPSGQALELKALEAAEYTSAVRRFRTFLRRRAIGLLQNSSRYLSTFSIDVREAPKSAPCANTAGWPRTQKVAMLQIEVDGDIATRTLGSISMSVGGRAVEVPFSSLASQTIRLETPVDYDAIKTLRLAPQGRGYLRSLSVAALNDPVVQWTNGVASALAITGGRGIALGTDLNAPEQQIPYTSIGTGPSDLAMRFGMAGARTLPAMPRATGSTYRIQRDGIANIGMLPDFLQAVDAAPGGSTVAEEIFHSAQDVVRMWQRADAYARANGSGPVQSTPAPSCGE